jgi:hypothetical protein
VVTSIPAGELWTVVDDIDAEMASQYTWHAVHYKEMIYARTNIRRNGKMTSVRLHNLIVQPPSGLGVDHIDHDGLNNQRSNLRIANRTQNNANTRKKLGLSSRYKGVTWIGGRKKYRRPWLAQLYSQGHNHNLGQFATEAEAAAAYDAAALALWGEFAYTNAMAVARGDIVP